MQDKGLQLWNREITGLATIILAMSAEDVALWITTVATAIGTAAYMLVRIGVLVYSLVESARRQERQRWHEITDSSPPKTKKPPRKPRRKADQ